MANLKDKQLQILKFINENPDENYAYKIQTLSPAQLFIQNSFDETSWGQSMQIIGMPGSGKTKASILFQQAITKSLATVGKLPGLIIITYTGHVFEDELNSSDNKYGKPLSSHLRELLDPLQLPAEVLENHIQIYGYKRFANLIFNGSIEEKNRCFPQNQYTFWDDKLENLVQTGQLTRDDGFMYQHDGCTIICDESQNMYSHEYLNRPGLMMSMISQKCKNSTILYLSATPLSKSSVETMHLVNFLTRDPKPLDFYFDKAESGYIPKPEFYKKLNDISDKVLFISPPAPENYPILIYEGENCLKDIHPHLKFNYIPCELTDIQKRLFRSSALQIGVKKNIEAAAVVTGDNDILYGSFCTTQMLRIIFTNKADLFNCSSKAAKLYELLIEHELLWSPGNILIMANIIVFPGAVFIEHMLELFGCVKYDTLLPNTEILCRICKGIHAHTSDHKVEPVYFATLHSDLKRNEFEKIYKTYNSKSNQFGKQISIIVGTSCVAVSVKFTETSKLIVVNTEVSTPLDEQVIGRVRRPGNFKCPGIPAEVHVFYLICTNGKERTYEQEKEIRKLEKNEGIMHIMSILLQSSYSYELFIQNPEHFKIKDAPVLIPRSAFASHEVYETFKIIKTKHKPRKVAVDPVLQSTILVENFIFMAVARLIKALLMIYEQISLPDAFQIAKKLKRFDSFKTTEVTMHHMRTVAYGLDTQAQHVLDDIENLYVNKYISERNMTFLFETFIQEHSTPIVVTNEHEIRLVRCEQDTLYLAIPSFERNLQSYVKFINIDELYKLQIIEIPPFMAAIRDANAELAIQAQLVHKQENEMQVFLSLPVSDVKSLIMDTIRGDCEDRIDKLEPLLQILCDLKLLYDRQSLNSVMQAFTTLRFPVAKMGSIYYYCTDGNIVPVPIDLFRPPPAKPTTSVFLIITTKTNKMLCKIKNYEEPMADKRKQHRGLDITTLQTKKLKQLLEDADEQGLKKIGYQLTLEMNNKVSQAIVLTNLYNLNKALRTANVIVEELFD